MFERRLRILLVLLTLFTAVLVVRAFAIQVVGRSHWAAESESALQDKTLLATTRGRLLDARGRELAIDQPCIDACVDYEAIAFDKPLKSLRETAAARATRNDPQFTALSPSEQTRLIDAEVSKVIREEGPETIKWLRAQARQRVRQQTDNYDDLPIKERWRLLNAAVCDVIADGEMMWHHLARLSGKSYDEIDEQRRQIVRRVETQRRIVWYNKFQRAMESKADQETPWYAWLMGESEVELDRFAVAVAEQSQAHPILANIDFSVRNQLAKQIERYPGLTLRPSVVRTYPYGAAACHVIGQITKVTAEDTSADPAKDDRLRRYADTDSIGRTGLEKLAENQLRGTRGSEAYDGDGALMERVEPQSGVDVVSTIDIELQRQIEEAFRHVVFAPNKETPPQELTMNGAAVVIDIASGEVRALASYPTYDLNQFSELYPKLVKQYLERPLTNRATLTALEPGSTVKPIIGLSAITEGIIGPRDTIECTGYLMINGRQYHDIGRCWTMRAFHVGHHQVPSADPHPTGHLSFADALERSCNIYHEVLGDKLGLDGVSRWYERFGLGRPTGIGLPEAAGRLPGSFVGPLDRRASTTWFAAMGQGHISATPIQMANVAATIARNGIWMRPSLVSGLRQENDRVDLQLSKAALAEAQLGMANAVNKAAGTGYTARMDELRVAAKTGSAQASALREVRRDPSGKPLLDPRGRVIYDEIRLGTTAAPNPRVPWYRAIGEAEDGVPSHAWMIGYAPAENPTLAYAVMIEYGGGGGQAAGSVVKRLLAACLKEGYLTPAVARGP
ncbi:MAG TPA: penicillin-binding transpeptidase domain-containing protein [Tepidisphaeraceae bacterium]|jgi:penicillin-binding protein 2